MDENKIKIIEEAKEELEKMLEDPEIRKMIEAREDALKDYNSAMYNAEKRGEEKGVKKGIKEGKNEIAKEMKEKRMRIDLIMELTKLTKEEIEKL